jgi:hypothetical protein
MSRGSASAFFQGLYAPVDGHQIELKLLNI